MKNHRLNLWPNDFITFLNSHFWIKVLSGVNPLRANPTKWSNTFKQFVGNLPTNFFSVYDHFVGLALRGLMYFCSLSEQFQESNQPAHSFQKWPIFMLSFFSDFSSLHVKVFKSVWPNYRVYIWGGKRGNFAEPLASFNNPRVYEQTSIVIYSFD